MKVAIVFLLFTTVVFTLAQSQCENCDGLQCNSTLHCCLVSRTTLRFWKRVISRCGLLARPRRFCEEPNSNGTYSRYCPCRAGYECRALNERFPRWKTCTPESSTSSTQSTVSSSTVTTVSETTTQSEGQTVPETATEPEGTTAAGGQQ
uniref:U45-Theraphotoxin-Sfo1a_1 n=1 Tax=Selenotholus foelschei TaxID=1905327 RepID=A0A482Z840_9ARAC